MSLTLSRRRLVLSSIAFGGVVAVAKSAWASLAPHTDLLTRARLELNRLGSSIPSGDTVGIADYTLSSSHSRFHLVDMMSGKISSFLVAHGRGSDPNHRGWVQRFSNEFGSYASSEGAYRTGDHYSGKHGRSMRLIGLDETNSNAERRAIVVHGAWYVNPTMIQKHGQLGRSEGCFAFAEADLGTILHRLGPGRLLLSAKL